MRAVWKRLRQLPLIGWLLGAVVLLGLLLVLVVQKLRIAQARLAVEHQLRKVKKDKDTAIAEILAGARQRGLDRQAEAAKRALFYEKERSKLVVKSMKTGGLADAVDKAFARRP